MVPHKAVQKAADTSTAALAQAYGEFLGKRYANRSIIWVLGGDRPGWTLPA